MNEKQWKWWQYVLAGFVLLVGLALYVVDHLDTVLFGREVQFDYLVPLLIAIALYVLFGLGLDFILDILTKGRKQ